MSMQGNAEIRVGVNLASGTQKRLQSQLNAMSKRLTLNINRVKIQNQQFQKSITQGISKANADIGKNVKQVTTANAKIVASNKKQISSIDAVIARYKMQKISYTEMQGAMDKMIKRGTFQQQSLKQQTKMITTMNKAEADNTKLQAQRNKVYQDATNIQNETTKATKNVNTANKNQVSSMDKLIARYKLGNITQEQFNDYSNRIVNSTRHKNKSFVEQERIMRRMRSTQQGLNDDQFKFSTMLSQGIKKMLIWSN